MDVAQNVIVTEQDCGSGDSLLKCQLSVESGGVIEPLSEERILGRTAFEDIVGPNSFEMICKAGEEI